ncbi:MAG: undecaprenyl/decaprenyl-phosphate alpha-N-acetylglucosaminyl 1-phosphate transferase [Candidatus Omnitrophica bacterium]|nr:undecaprenyl/decaprenyl-phosphate alpha-N-acetylglucosaminyl 1-phosphate transferase [Candidatus Omnitrophota bacterium]
MKTFIFVPISFFFKYGLPFSLALSLSLILTPIIRKFAVKHKFVSFPKKDRWRKRLVASLGGVAIFIAFLLPYLIFGTSNLMFLGFVFGALGIFWLGVMDDIKHIKPDTKLIGQIIIACIVTMFGIGFNVSSMSLINIPLTIFWMVGITNAFNLLDNMDGLCAGIAAISSFVLGIYSVMNRNVHLTVLSLILFGATLGFLKYNFNPAKIIMGN